MRTVNAKEEMTGVFAGPIRGLRYQTPTTNGFTNERGEFRYRKGEAVSFRVGGLVLGAVEGAPRVNLSQLVNRVAGRIDRLHDPLVTNLARLVQTLDQDGDVESGVTIAPQVHELIEPMVIDFGQADVATDPAVVALLEKLNAAPGVFTTREPRGIRQAAAARNTLRRDIRGIVKMTDVKIPLRDGSFLYADVFRPAGDGRHPVVMSLGFYGKAFNHECICGEDDALEKEELEDRYFSGNPDGLQYENHESVDSAVWVPKGYVCVRVDARGVGNSPGLQRPLSVQEAEDNYDVIEWAGTQPWSNGSVGLWGMSYLAMTQHNVASLRPPHLKAMIALGTDADLYNETLYNGGIFGEGFWTWWWKAWSGRNFCGEERRESDWMTRTLATPFNDPAAYGARGSIFMRPEVEKSTAAVWIVGPQTGVAIHQLGSSETFIRSTGAVARKFDFVDAWFPYSYKGSTIAEHMRFFDHWLKGEDNGAMDGAPVRVQVRTGNAAHFVLEEAEWPIARTEYRRWYLDGGPSHWQGDTQRDDLRRLTESIPGAERSASYEAHLELGQPTLAPTGPVGGTPRWSTGISFVSDPMSEDLVLAGYMKTGLWVSSTSSDMDVFVSLRVIDEEDREIRYEALVHPIDPEHAHPVGHGMLKVSRRTLDEARSTRYWPVHTHAEADHRPLQDGEIVPIELGLNPSTALIRKGCRLRVDVQPYAPAAVPVRAYDASYHVGARNAIHTGPDHPSYVQLPIVPLR
ncbi:CocE/NonD family hydrolase [Streptomyces montanisoli]|uniref:CocE/NonD family hydrolase n=1 Tax=Streptomyces montanisoli TaxID=2798581 RepID=A0A940RT42_9ACTN|nr:CocE/NonD family hydrolase [Streptomyces montanisoli]MBP0456442.1 CocE/NonD family hydrolase [Streptomyces montanisoli]